MKTYQDERLKALIPLIKINIIRIKKSQLN